jgi:hypothetical protein
MGLKLTVACVTAKAEPRFDLLVPSLCCSQPFELIVVDLNLGYEPVRGQQLEALVAGRFPLTHVAPKPSRWQGPDRITNRDCWAVQNARNTAILRAQAQRIYWVDDCSFLLPEALDLHCDLPEDVALAVGWSSDKRRDTRRLHWRRRQLIPGEYAWSNNLSYSMAAANVVQGYDEAYDGAPRCGDTDCGIRMERIGVKLLYDPTITQRFTDRDRSRPVTGKGASENSKLLQELRQEPSRFLPRFGSSNFDVMQEGAASL